MNNTANLKTPLQIIILLFISIPQLIFGQGNKSSTKITLNSITVNNDSTKDASEVINVDNLDHAMFILDSILII